VRISVEHLSSTKTDRADPAVEVDQVDPTAKADQVDPVVEAVEAAFGGRDCGLQVAGGDVYAVDGENGVSRPTGAREVEE